MPRRLGRRRFLLAAGAPILAACGGAAGPTGAATRVVLATKPAAGATARPAAAGAGGAPASQAAGTAPAPAGATAAAPGAASAAAGQAGSNSADMPPAPSAAAPGASTTPPVSVPAPAPDRKSTR